MREVNRFYAANDSAGGTHLALSWKGGVRYVVPRETRGQRTCWEVFRPGPLEFALRAMARFPRVCGSVGCVESEALKTIRTEIATQAGLSCCRAGAEGVWHKDTILLLDGRSCEPLLLLKVGPMAAVGSLLRNEAEWLRTLRGEVSLATAVPELVTYHSGPDICYVAQSVFSGDLGFTLGTPHMDFIAKLQQCSIKVMHYEESVLCRTLHARIKDLDGLLPDAWSRRLDTGMRLIEQSLCGAPVLMVGAHNDFTPWNIRLRHGVAQVFDWEYAAHEQMPLFDILHFAASPLALKNASSARILRGMRAAIEQYRRAFGMERCHGTDMQILAYMISLCSLYLWADRGTRNAHPSLVSYARVIDELCHSAAGH